MGGTCNVYLQRTTPQRVGTLRLNHVRGKLASVFSYAGEWLEAPQTFALSPDLPLDPYLKTCEGLFLCFQDCSPDRWGKALLRRQEIAQAEAENRKPRTLLDSDFLLRVNDVTRQGAIRLSVDEGKSFLAESGAGSVPPLVFLPRLLNAARNIDARTETDADLRMLVAPGSSLGGARPKASVLGKNGELLIAKFPSRNDDRDIPLWEDVTFQLARRAGIRTPEVQLRNVAGKSVLLVQRFDRRGADRIPFISAMSLLEARDGDHMSYVDMASVLQAEGSAPAEDLHELWSRMVFNMCVYNVDDHLRNHGFLREPLGWRLSPVYDLETSHPTEKAAFLHTAIMEERNAFSVSDALEAAEFFRFSQKEAKRRLVEIRKAVSHWRQEATLVNASPSEIRFMREAFEYL